MDHGSVVFPGDAGYYNAAQRIDFVRVVMNGIRSIKDFRGEMRSVRLYSEDMAKVPAASVR